MHYSVLLSNADAARTICIRAATAIKNASRRTGSLALDVAIPWRLSIAALRCARSAIQMNIEVILDAMREIKGLTFGERSDIF